MSKLWILGDFHLSGESPWQEAVSNKVIDWIRDHELNDPDNEILLAGDLIDKYNASPRSHYLVLKFLTSLRAKKIHVVVGNHDIEKSPEGQTLAYEYAKVLGESIHVYEYPQIITSMGLNILVVPFYKAPIHSLVDLKPYEDTHPLEKRGIDPNTPFDLVLVHHFVKSSTQTQIPDEITIDMDYLTPNAKKVLAGHVHIADALPEVYLGSLYAKKIDEQGQRYYWVYNYNTLKWQRFKTPVFCELKSVKYGEKLPTPMYKDAIQVYTITQCPSIEKAQLYYGPEVHIRKTISSWDHIRTNQEFSEIDRARYDGGMISKEELMSKFEDMVLSDVEEWKKKDISQDTLKAAVRFIKHVSEKGADKIIEETENAANQ